MLPIRFGVLTLAAALVVASDAGATALSWVLAGNGSAATASNWSPAQVPAAADALTFNLAGARVISWNATVGSSTSHTYRTGGTTLLFTSPHFASGTCTIGSLAGDNPLVTQTSGTFAVGGNTTLGSVAGCNGQFTVSGNNVLFQTQNAGADVIAGHSGSGTLSAANGGIIRVADDLLIGNNVGATGSVNVTGVGSFNASTIETEDVNGDVFVANLGNGTLNVTSGGHLSAMDDLFVAPNAGSTGNATIATNSALVTVNDLCYVGYNTSGTASGTATVNVNAGGSLIVKNELRAGDPNGGTGTLHLNGGFVHTRSFSADSTHGVLDVDGGTLRIDGGTGSMPAGLSGSDAAGPLSLEFVRGAAVTADEIYLTGGPGSSHALLLDSGASLSIANTLFLISGTGSVVVDSSAKLTTSRDINLGGSSSNSSLTIDHGGVVTCQTFESADEASGQATIQVQGANSKLTWWGNFFVGGDVGNIGGPVTMHVGSGGLVNGTVTTSNMTINAPSTLVLDPSGSVVTPGSLTVRGLLQMNGGTGNVNVGSVLNNGRIEGHGTLVARISATQNSTRIAAVGGNLVVGNAASSSGFSFAGTIAAGSNTLTLNDSNGAAVGDTTTVDGGTLVAPGGLSVPASGFVAATGTITTPTLSNFGVLAMGGSTPGNLSLSNVLTLLAGSTLRMRIEGTNAGQADRVQVTGQANLAGTLHLVFTPNGSYAANTPITLLECATRVGTFPSLVVDGMDPSKFTVVYTATKVQVIFNQPVAVEGDLPTVLAFSGKSSVEGPGPWFELALPADATTRIDLYDVRGRAIVRLADGPATAGIHRYPLPPGMARGVYFARVIVAGRETRSARVTVF